MLDFRSYVRTNARMREATGDEIGAAQWYARFIKFAVRPPAAADAIAGRDRRIWTGQLYATGGPDGRYCLLHQSDAGRCRESCLGPIVYT